MWRFLKITIKNKSCKKKYKNLFDIIISYLNEICDS